MTRRFDFSTYRHVPKPWRILRADDEFWVCRKGSDRTYRVTCPVSGEFELWYRGAIQDGAKEDAWQFIMRTQGFHHAMKACGLLVPQAHYSRQSNLSIRREINNR